MPSTPTRCSTMTAPILPPASSGTTGRVTSAGVNNGVWQHLSVTQSVTTATGNVLLRLLMNPKHSGPQSVSWDNVHLTIKQGGTTVFAFGEDFEAGLGNWTAMNWAQVHSHNDAPRTFSSTDALLYANTGNPGSISAGFSSNMSVFDGTRPSGFNGS